MTYTEVRYISKIYYHTKFHDPTLNAASVAPTSKLCKAAMLLLLTVSKLVRSLFKSHFIPRKKSPRTRLTERTIHATTRNRTFIIEAVANHFTDWPIQVYFTPLTLFTSFRGENVV